MAQCKVSQHLWHFFGFPEHLFPMVFVLHLGHVFSGLSLLLFGVVLVLLFGARTCSAVGLAKMEDRWFGILLAPVLLSVGVEPEGFCAF